MLEQFFIFLLAVIALISLVAEFTCDYRECVFIQGFGFMLNFDVNYTDREVTLQTILIFMITTYKWKF